MLAERRGLRGYQGFFLALTLVVMIVIILSAESLTVAIVMIGLITQFLIISSQLTLLGDRHVAVSEGGRARAGRALDNAVMVLPAPAAALVEGFTGATTAPPGAGPPAWARIPVGDRDEGESRGEGGDGDKSGGGGRDKSDGGAGEGAAEEYRGAIDFGGEGAETGDQAPALGHSDWDAAARADVPEGNPFDPGRVARPQAAAPCEDDDAFAIHDADELVTYQNRSRNVPERVWAGIYRRKALVERYVREELDERENSQWWGAHEV